MSTVTVFFSGTNSTSEDNNHREFLQGELVAKLAKNVVGKDNIDYIHVDGVGSGNLSEWRKQTSYEVHGFLSGQIGGRGIANNISHVINLLTGTYTMKDRKYKARASSLLSESRPYRLSSAYSRWRKERDALAHDLDAGLRLQMNNIREERRRCPITQLNLIGWSRGGVSCFELANELLNHKQLATINVNIFALDPVPGGLNNFKNCYQLSNNVKQVVCFFAKDEHSVGFRALMPKLHRSTKSYITFMPGRHATLVGNWRTSSSNKGVDLIGRPGAITRDFAEKVLTSWGTRLSNKFNYSRAEILSLYKIMVDYDLKMIKKMRNESYTKIHDRKSQRSVKQLTTRPIYSKEMWVDGNLIDVVNQHHHDVLKGNIFAIRGDASAMR